MFRPRHQLSSPSLRNQAPQRRIYRFLFPTGDIELNQDGSYVNEFE